MAEIDELKKLSPEERIKRLKKLEEEKRKEIEEAEKLMKESVTELEREEKIKKDVPIPQVQAVDIDQLFTAEEKQLVATKKYQDSKLRLEEGEEKKLGKEKPEKTLEDEVWKEQLNLSEEQLEQQRQYGEQLAAEPANQLYEAARDAYEEFRETGAVDPATVYRLDVAIREKDASGGGEYKADSERMQEQFGSAKSIVKYLRGF